LRNRSEENIYRPLLNCLIVFAVLSGLFFSNAEGIRLLPFPDCAASNSSAGDTDQPSFCLLGYSPAIQRSQAKYPARAKLKQSHRLDTAASAAMPVQAVDLPKWSAFPLQNSSASWQFAFSCFADAQPSRGPPSI
jgi:hypothetical protein